MKGKIKKFLAERFGITFYLRTPKHKFKDPRWYTYDRINYLGATVRMGEEPSLIEWLSFDKKGKRVFSSAYMFNAEQLVNLPISGGLHSGDLHFPLSFFVRSPIHLMQMMKDCSYCENPNNHQTPKSLIKFLNKEHLKNY